jgi:hypothetical protein
LGWKGPRFYQVEFFGRISSHLGLVVRLGFSKIALRGPNPVLEGGLKGGWLVT